MSAGLAASGAVSGGFSANMMMCLVASESLANMQYLNLNHSKIASTIYTTISSSYVPNWFAPFNILQREALVFNWGIFQKDQISSLYLDNYGDSMTEVMIYAGIYLTTSLFKFLSKTNKLVDSFARKAYLTAFSLLVSNILGILQGQILFSILQIIRMDLFLDKYSRLSLITGYLTLSICLGLLFFCFFRLENIYNNKKRLKSRLVEISRNDKIDTQLQYEWLEKK
jgi:hypothetical protein